MRSLLVVFAVVGVAVARPTIFNLGLGAVHAPAVVHAPVAYSTFAEEPAPITYTAPVAYTAPIAYTAPASSQYHAQDELGQYSYGYVGGPSAKSEIKTWDGVTRGGYSYVDAEGKLQTVNYIADSVNGFRVAATNLPVAPEVPDVADVPAVPEVPAAEPLVAPTPVEDTAEVAAAKEAHFALYAEAKAAAEASPEEPVPEAEEPAPIPAAEEPAPTPAADEPESVAVGAAQPVAVAYSAVAHPVVPAEYLTGKPGSIPPSAPEHTIAYSAVAHAPIAYAAPSPIAYAPPAPIAYAAPGPIAYAAPAPIAYVAPASSQFHAQDEIGQYTYGYAGGPSAKSEVKTWDGVIRGEYSYVDAEGELQTVNYIADPVSGFRVAATNLPEAPEAAEAPALETVSDTAEVAAAKSAHLSDWEETKEKLVVIMKFPESAEARSAREYNAALSVPDTPEVAAAKAAHLATWEETKESLANQ